MIQFQRVAHVNSFPRSIQNNLHFICPTLPLSLPTLSAVSPNDYLEQTSVPLEGIESLSLEVDKQVLSDVGGGCHSF